MKCCSSMLHFSGQQSSAAETNSFHCIARLLLWSLARILCGQMWLMRFGYLMHQPGKSQHRGVPGVKMARDFATTSLPQIERTMVLWEVVELPLAVRNRGRW